MRTLPKIIVISDFDGTVVDLDTAALILQRFAEGKWKEFDRQLEKGEISLQRCLRKQFSLVRASKEQILGEVERATTFRHNFDRLVKYCERRRIPIIIASAGLDFCIRHLLAEKGIDRFISLLAGKARVTNRGIKFSSFPRLERSGSHNFKDGFVTHYQRHGFRAVYLGDTSLDYQAAKIADLSFAIRGSHLAQMCRKAQVPCKEFHDFQQVIDEIQTRIISKS